MIAEYIKSWNMKLSEWLLYHQRNIHFKYKYHGLDMQKNPMDLMIYMELLWKIKPDVVIEIGGAGGGTALWLCDQMESIGTLHSIVISVDINHTGFKAEHEKIIKVTGNSTTEQTRNAVHSLVEDDDKVLLIHDGSHKQCDIEKDFANYHDLINVGSYFIIEDGIMDVMDWKDHRTAGHNCGMVAGIELTKKYKNWIIDYDCEKYIMTYNPCGYLRRIS